MLKENTGGEAAAFIMGSARKDTQGGTKETRESWKGFWGSDCLLFVRGSFVVGRVANGYGWQA